MKVNKKGLTESGFTLVEIAIVLVIIGLLLGGILKGQEMITQAKIKNIINDFNGVTAAVNSYQDRYRAMPGDDGTAGTRWTTQGAVSGNGDGILGVGAGTTCRYNAVVTGTPVAAQECNLFWWHLRLAGFVPGAVIGVGRTEHAVLHFPWASVEERIEAVRHATHRTRLVDMRGVPLAGHD